MNIKYFEDTDTALVTFSGSEVAEPKEINENMYADIDSNGNIVSLTIEHARRSADMPKFDFEVISG